MFVRETTAESGWEIAPYGKGSSTGGSSVMNRRAFARKNFKRTSRRAGTGSCSSFSGNIQGRCMWGNFAKIQSCASHLRPSSARRVSRTLSASGETAGERGPKYPRRTSHHVLETRARGVLLRCLPPRWLCREVLERDYGIDFYLEMVGDRGHLTGHVAAIQLKGRQQIRWRGRTREDILDWFYLDRISKRTISYWMELQLPVLIFVADLSTSKVFLIPVKRQIRARYTDFLSRRTFSFRVLGLNRLGSTFGERCLSQEYFRERGHDGFMARARDLVAHLDAYQDLLGSVSAVRDADVVKVLPWKIALYLSGTCAAILEHHKGREARLRLEKQLGALPKVDVLQGTEPSGTVFRDRLKIL